VSDTALQSLPDLTGEVFRSVLNRLHQALAPRSYLEIGINEGKTFQLARCPSIGVDPDFELISTDAVQNKPFCGLYRLSSDQFFSSVAPSVVLGRPIDFAFIDGMHLCEFVLRDFLNTEKFCHRNSIIALHDCLPLDFVMAEREFPVCSDPNLEHRHRAGWWTGDVWRCALLLKRCRPDLRMTVVDASPTGLMLVTNLDPCSTMLTQDYASAVETMHQMSLHRLSLPGLHAELNVQPASVLLSTEWLTPFDRSGEL